MDYQELKFQVMSQVVAEYRASKLPIDSNLINELLLQFHHSLVGPRVARQELDSIPYDTFYESHILEIVAPARRNDAICSTYHVTDFVVLCLFRHRTASDSMDRAFAKFRRHVTINLPGYRVSAPFAVFSRFSYGFALSGPNLEMLNSLYYCLLHHITSQDDSTVFDSVKIMLTDWALSAELYASGLFSRTGATGDVAPHAIILVKYDMGKVKNTELATENIAHKLSALAWGENVTLRLHGGISWHELVIFVYGCRVGRLADIAWQIRGMESVSETNTLITHPLDHGAQCVDVLDDPMRLLSISKYSPSVRPATHGHDLKDNESFLYGHADHLAEFEVHGIADAHDAVSKHDTRPDLDIETVMVLTKNRGIALNNSYLSAVPASSAQYEDLSYSIERCHVDPGCSVAKLLFVYATKIKCMLSRTSAVFGIDSRIVQSLELVAAEHRAGRISEECALFVLSETQAAIAQRLAGPSVAAGNQIMGGIGEQHGGHNVILLACETLFNLVLRYSLAREYNDVTPEKFPSLCLVRFASPFSGMTQFSLRRYARELGQFMLSGNIPVFIHLPGLKYQPWNWALSLSLLQPWIDTQSDPMLRARIPDWQDLHGHLSGIVTSILCQDIHRHLLRIQSGELAYRFDMAGNISEVAIHEAATSHTDMFQSNRERCRRWDITESRMAELEGEYKYAMMKGAVVLDHLDNGAKIAAFANAYCGLHMDEVAGAKAFSSFILTLYRQHPQFVKE